MSVSLCVLRVEVDEELPEMSGNVGDNESAKECKKRDRGARESRTITVETYASVVGGGTDVGILPTSTRRLTETVDETNDDTISFFCGNPLVEVTKGVLHIYKENARIPSNNVQTSSDVKNSVEISTSPQMFELRNACLDSDLQSPFAPKNSETTSELKEPDDVTGEGSTMLCLLAVPAALGARDLLAFAAACQQDIAHVRVLRDGTPSHYMALLTFRTAQSASEFHSAFDGVPYSTLEPGALCHTAWVSRVEWARDGTPPPSHTELPTCPVCLERMDESVAGVLSVQCAHAFHTDCLLGWGDASCPVCRCSQTPEPLDHAHCFECERLQEERDTSEVENADESKENMSGIAEGLLDGVGVGTLWICLICGHVGCGRYEAGHAAKHFRESNHTYALQLGSNRVWDYAGDNFVHRLVQNKADGKLVAAGGEEDNDDGATCGPTGDKLDSAQLEFTYILTQQLERQRLFYEEKLSRMEAEHKEECEELRARAVRAETAAAAFKERLTTITKENKSLHQKLQQVTTKLSTMQNELSEERSLAKAMANSQAEWQSRAKIKEENFHKEITELKEQLRDVMFFVEARGQLERTEAASSAEIEGATVTVAPPTGKKGRRNKR